MVMIPKPDLTKTNCWRSINLINCIGKLGEKVVTNYLQDIQSFHAGQYGGRKWRAVADMVA